MHGDALEKATPWRPIFGGGALTWLVDTVGTVI